MRPYTENWKVRWRAAEGGGPYGLTESRNLRVGVVIGHGAFFGYDGQARGRYGG